MDKIRLNMSDTPTLIYENNCSVCVRLFVVFTLCRTIKFNYASLQFSGIFNVHHSKSEMSFFMETIVLCVNDFPI